MTMTRAFFCTDVHGSELCFRKFLGSGRFYKADVLILGGDMTGKLIVSIIEESDCAYVARYLGKERRAHNEAELRSLEKEILDSGFYPYRTNPSELEELESNRAKVDELFSRLMLENVKRWINMAEESLRPTNVRCFVMPGNDDRLEIDQAFSDSQHVINPEGKVICLDQHHEMMSTGYSNISPWKAPRDSTEEELGRRIEAMAPHVKDMAKCLFNFHCPPYNSRIDMAPKLDANLRPEVEGGRFRMIPVGSVAIRAAIEKYQPLMGLHGHIHESRGEQKIGRTLCINPGSEYSEGILRGALINLDEKGVKSYLLTSG